jgi:hypothetical protein
MSWFETNTNLKMAIFATFAYALGIISLLYAITLLAIGMVIFDIVVSAKVIEIKGRSKWLIFVLLIPGGMYWLAFMQNRKEMERTYQAGSTDS